MRVLITITCLHLFGCLTFVGATTAFRVLIQGDRPRLTRRGAGGFIREWLGSALIFALVPLGLMTTRPRATGSPQDRDPAQLPGLPVRCPPVLMVPGYGLNRSCFTFLAFYLRRRGWTHVWGINNMPRSSRIPIYAHHLAQRVEQLCADTGWPQVDIVAHSMGGLVTAWYVQKLGGSARVRRVVSLGTPWAGSQLAVFGQRSEGVDMLPGSSTLRQLCPPSLPWTALWSPHDTIVLPPHSARIPGALNVSLAHVGHVSLLLSAQAFRLIAGALAASDPAVGLDPTPPPAPQAVPHGDRTPVLSADAP